MPNTNDNAIVVKRQNFDSAMKSIKNFSDQAQELEPLSRVSHSGGLFGLGDHKVTGTELNTVVSQVEDKLIDLKNFNLEFLVLITNIYTALDALDQEHISGILIAANAAKAASDKATENVEAIQKIVKVLKKFKEKLEKLEHLLDIDKAWKLLENQDQLLKVLSGYKDELSALEHLKDVDKLWAKQNSQVKFLENLEKKLSGISKTLDVQGRSIANFTDIVTDISESQQAFIDYTNEHLVDQQADIERRFDGREKAMQERFSSLSETVNRSQVNLVKKFDDFSKSQTDKFDRIEKFQAEQLSAIQKSQTEALCQISEEQSLALNSIEKVQSDRLNQISKEQTEAIDQLSNEQVEKLEAINKSLEEEKSALNETVAALTQKVKIAYILAGGTGFVVVIHLLLNIIGVL